MTKFIDILVRLVFLLVLFVSSVSSTGIETASPSEPFPPSPLFNPVTIAVSSLLPAIPTLKAVLYDNRSSTLLSAQRALLVASFAGGPFALNLAVVAATGNQQQQRRHQNQSFSLFLEDEELEASITTTSLAAFLDERQTQLHLSITSHLDHTVELTRAAFRGNLELEHLGLVLWPNRTIYLSNVRAGTAFVALSVPGGSTTTSTSTSTRFPLARVEQVLLISSLSTNYSLAQRQQQNTRIKQQQQELLLLYLKSQREAFLFVQPFLLPPLLQRRSPFLLFDLSPTLAHSLSSFHNAHRALAVGLAEHEPPISLVFNQDVAPTTHVPLTDNLMQQVRRAVLIKAAEWLNTPVSKLHITGAYGAREYAKHAVVRWHVDPAESQPITAIVHIANSNNSDNSSSEHPCWELQLRHHLHQHQQQHQQEEQQEEQGEEVIEESSICLNPGQVLLFESARLPHARAFALQHDWYANVFVHLAPHKWRVFL